MGELSMMVDLAHASPRLVQDVLTEVRRLRSLDLPAPSIVVSHTGLTRFIDTVRHLTDDQVRALIEADALIGLGYFFASGQPVSVREYARMMAHAASLSPDAPAHLALGSDFDGLIGAPVDASDLDQITDALLHAVNDRGQPAFTEAGVAAIMGGNALRFLSRALPPRR
jgi:microsomal dipeptidase-like Zn-dependent dipeptidase